MLAEALCFLPIVSRQSSIKLLRDKLGFKFDECRHMARRVFQEQSPPYDFEEYIMRKHLANWARAKISLVITYNYTPKRSQHKTLLNNFARFGSLLEVV
jgi:hypothetical protein